VNASPSRPDPRRQRIVAFAAGLCFGAGLIVSGMTRPAKVLGFLNVVGEWDASLLFVMAGAIAVHFTAYRLLRGRPSPYFAERFWLPTRRDIDRRLVIGAAVFGVGWGLAGYCPGPAVVALPLGGASPLVFVLGMFLGMLIHSKLESRQTPGPASSASSAEPPAPGSGAAVADG
jgi:uncharacterized membrane protein YedE/YeeE